MLKSVHALASLLSAGHPSHGTLDDRTIEGFARESTSSSTATSTDASQQVWAPILAALLLDFADVLSFGPQGIVIGLIVGATLGYRIAAMCGLSQRARLLCAGLGFLYCAVPGTEVVPLATMLAGFDRLRHLLAAVR